MIRIGAFQTDCQVFLAPIAGYTDLAFRLVVREAGHRGLAYTELLNPRGILRQGKASLDIAATCAEDRPLGVQLYGNEVEWFCEAAKWAEGQGADLIDINMGCPVDKVTKTNGGSMLLCNPERTGGMAERIVKSVNIPVTAKLRLGWDREHLTSPGLARRLEDIGIALLTVHGRTTDQFFKGAADLEGIAAVAAAVKSIPVIGNGDIATPADAVRMIEATGCAGVMIARAAIKRPWALRDIDAVLREEAAPAEPNVLEKVRLIRRHFELMRQYRDDRHAVITMRGRFGPYSASLGHIKPIKERVRLMTSVGEFEAAMDDLESAIDGAPWTTVPRGVISFESQAGGVEVEPVAVA